MTEDRTVRRLEAFSDIVIGFGLAQLGAALTLQPKTMTLAPAGVIAFFGAFAIVCSLWYFHHRLFEYFFVPKALPIVLNFLWLAIVVLLVYSAVQFPGQGFAHRNLDMLYFALYALAYGILAVQTVLGMRELRIAEPQQRLRAVRNVSFMTYWALIFVVCFALVDFLPQTSGLGYAINWTFLIGSGGSVAMVVYFRRHRTALADA